MWYILYSISLSYDSFKKKELIDRFKEFTVNYTDLDGDYSSWTTLSS